MTDLHPRLCALAAQIEMRCDVEFNPSQLTWRKNGFYWVLTDGGQYFVWGEHPGWVLPRDCDPHTALRYAEVLETLQVELQTLWREDLGWGPERPWPGGPGYFQRIREAFVAAGLAWVSPVWVDGVQVAAHGGQP